LNYKQQAAEAAVALVESGMLIGLGHGSTVEFAVKALATKIKAGALIDIRAVPCSKHTERLASELGIALVDLNDYPRLDLTIDGADEIDPQFNLIKGGGGALLREKIVAQASVREVIVVDESKLSEALGTKHALPVEVIEFGWQAQLAFLTGLESNAALRINTAGEPVLSDQGNLLIDCDFGPIGDVHALARKLEERSGIVEHGLFLGLATDVIVAGPDGLRHLKA
jgi:ribose 5-phosphate isomerase A